MLSLLFTLPLLAFPASATLECDALPWKLPFHTANGPHIYSADNKEVTYLGTNWPGHQNAMIPEGLQYSSVKDIVSHITGLGLNSVRLTFAIELVDDIYDGVDATLEYTLTNALGAENGTIVLGEVLAHNPQFTKDTTRLEVYDAVALELAAQGVYLHLDNHVSKAIWCCSNNDGNAWFGDEYFNVTNWLRGWKFMAAHVSLSFKFFSDTINKI
jgi:endoglucanase